MYQIPRIHKYPSPRDRQISSYSIMPDEIDQSSFASILEGVRKMRESYNSPKLSEQLGRTLEKPQQQQPQPAAQPVAAPAQAAQAAAATTNVQETSRSTLDTAAQVQPPKNRNRQNRPTGSRRVRDTVQTYTSVQVAHSQKGNPLLESPSMKLTPWAYNTQILLDYYINATLQVLFLLLKYHKLRPEYVWRRIEKMKGGSSIVEERQEGDEVLRVLLVVVDVDSPQDAIRSLLSICIRHDLSIVVAWLFEEAGNYIAYFKLNEMVRSKVDLSIQGLKMEDYNSTIVSSLTTVRAVNKTDVANLLANCKSFKLIVSMATENDGLSHIQGLGERKLLNLRAAFAEPFIFNKDYEAEN